MYQTGDVDDFALGTSWKERLGYLARLVVLQRPFGRKASEGGFSDIRILSPFHLGHMLYGWRVYLQIEDEVRPGLADACSIWDSEKPTGRMGLPEEFSWAVVLFCSSTGH